jgi:hypothetical protein
LETEVAERGGGKPVSLRLGSGILHAAPLALITDMDTIFSVPKALVSCCELIGICSG